MNQQSSASNIQCIPCFVFNIRHVNIAADDPHNEEKFIHVKKATPEDRKKTKAGELTLVKITCDECHADRGIYHAKLQVEYDLIHATCEQLTSVDLKNYIEAHTKK